MENQAGTQKQKETDRQNRENKRKTKVRETHMHRNSYFLVEITKGRDVQRKCTDVRQGTKDRHRCKYPEGAGLGGQGPRDSKRQRVRWKPCREL